MAVSMSSMYIQGSADLPPDSMSLANLMRLCFSSTRYSGARSSSPFLSFNAVSAIEGPVGVEPTTRHFCGMNSLAIRFPFVFVSSLNVFTF